MERLISQKLLDHLPGYELYCRLFLQVSLILPKHLFGGIITTYWVGQHNISYISQSCTVDRMKFICYFTFIISLLSVFFFNHLSHQGSPKSTGVGCYSLLYGIFPMQGLNPGLLHYRQILYHLSHQESPLNFYCILNIVRS